jgi:NAD(P)-dependent dehydrogenase (short-subunit alcohol dehydrogenase family)
VQAPCDVTDTGQLVTVLEDAGEIDVLVNSAGTNRPEPFAAVTPETFDELFALNVRAAFFASQAVVRRLRGAGRTGVIVNISSQMGHVGAAERSVYCATKHAIEGLTKSVALETAADGIRIVSIAPTFVRTELTASQLDDPEVGQRILAQIPLGRPGTADEIAAAVVFAASPEAGLLTGSSVLLDGGWTAG